VSKIATVFLNDDLLCICHHGDASSLQAVSSAIVKQTERNDLMYCCSTVEMSIHLSNLYARIVYAGRIDLQIFLRTGGQEYCFTKDYYYYFLFF